MYCDKYNPCLFIYQVEKTRHFICAFLLIRELLMTFEGKEETQLPLVDRTKCFAFDTSINLS